MPRKNIRTRLQTRGYSAGMAHFSRAGIVAFTKSEREYGARAEYRLFPERKEMRKFILRPRLPNVSDKKWPHSSLGSTVAKKSSHSSRLGWHIFTSSLFIPSRMAMEESRGLSQRCPWLDWRTAHSASTACLPRFANSDGAITRFLRIRRKEEWT